LGQAVEALGLLAGRKRQRHRLDTIGLQAVHQLIEIDRADILVSDDSRLAALDAGGDLAAGATDQAGADQDVVGAFAERYVDQPLFALCLSHRSCCLYRYIREWLPALP